MGGRVPRAAPLTSPERVQVRHLEQVLVFEAEVPVVLGHHLDEFHGGPRHVVVPDDLVHAGGQVPAYVQAVVLHEPEDVLVGGGELLHQFVQDCAVFGVVAADEGAGQREVQGLSPREERVPVRLLEYFLDLILGKEEGEEGRDASEARGDPVFAGVGVPRHVDRRLRAQVE